MKKQRFSSVQKNKMEEIFLVAENAGLVREGLQYERKKSDRYPNWIDVFTLRRFRYLETTQELEVSEDPKDFDRWGNSRLESYRIPDTLEDFSKLIEKMRYLQPEIEHKVTYSRKSKNK